MFDDGGSAGEMQPQKHSWSGLQEGEAGVGRKVRNCLAQCRLL